MQKACKSILASSQVASVESVPTWSPAEAEVIDDCIVEGRRKRRHRRERGKHHGARASYRLGAPPVHATGAASSRPSDAGPRARGEEPEHPGQAKDLREGGEDAV